MTQLFENLNFILNNFALCSQKAIGTNKSNAYQKRNVFENNPLLCEYV